MHLTRINAELGYRARANQERFDALVAEKAQVVRALEHSQLRACAAETRLAQLESVEASAQLRASLAAAEERLVSETRRSERAEDRARKLAERLARAEARCEELAFALHRPTHGRGPAEVQPPRSQVAERQQHGVPELDQPGESPDLAGRNVLCVGGRTRLADRYRTLVERHNGRFEHHDGGQEDNPKRLQSRLATADAVICLADCVSHNAYYAVKRYCKAYGKACVLLGNSGLASFVEGIRAVATPRARATFRAKLN